MAGAAVVVWVFVDGLGLAPAGEVPGGCTPWLDRRLGVRCLEDTPDGGRPDARRFALDAALGVDGRPGTATGQASLLTGRNAAVAMERHVHAFPGPQLRGFVDGAGTVLHRLHAGGARVALLTTYPAKARETTLRYGARSAGAALVGNPDDPHAVWPNLGATRDGGGPDPRQVGEWAAQFARGYDLAVVETDLCDRAGHLREGRRSTQAAAIAHVDGFLAGLCEALGAGGVVVVASDHGNAEAPERGHNRHRVPLVQLGGEIRAPAGEDLTAFAPWLEGLVERTRRVRV